MKNVLLLIAGVFGPGLGVAFAQAQFSSCPTGQAAVWHDDGGPRCETVPMRTDLDRAHEICGQHEIASNVMFTDGSYYSQSMPGSYPSDWAACYEVRKKWDLSESARVERERVASLKADMEFVRRVAGVPK